MLSRSWNPFDDLGPSQSELVWFACLNLLWVACAIIQHTNTFCEYSVLVIERPNPSDPPCHMTHWL